MPDDLQHVIDRAAAIVAQWPAWKRAVIATEPGDDC